MMTAGGIAGASGEWGCAFGVAGSEMGWDDGAEQAAGDFLFGTAGAVHGVGDEQYRAVDSGEWSWVGLCARGCGGA